MVKLWRYKDAIEPYRLAAKNAPRDMRSWKSLATSYGSVKQYPEALEAAQRGLQIEPRNVDLLRVQMLALNKLSPQSEQAQMARKTFLEFKRDEAAPEIRSRCSDESNVCLRERLPGHIHEMRRAEAKGL